MKLSFYSVLAIVVLSLCSENLLASRLPSFTDYVLYEEPGLKITSDYDKPGQSWCEHVYVSVLAEYDGADEERPAKFAPDYETFLRTKIVPKIQTICEKFPTDASKWTHIQQSLRLRFKRAGDSDVLGEIFYKIDPDGSLSMTSDGRRVKPAPTEDVIAAFSEGAYRIQGNFLVTTWEVRRTTATAPACTYWLESGLDELNGMSDEEFAALAGGHPVIGNMGLDSLYLREERRMVWRKSGESNAKAGSEYIAKLKRDGKLEDFPILCGIGVLAAVAEVNASLAEKPIIPTPNDRSQIQSQQTKHQQTQPTIVVPTSSQAGTVTKSTEFWDRLQFSGTVRETFDGDYAGPPDDTFKLYYFSAQVAFSDSCKSSLSSNRQRRGYTQTTSFGDGSSDSKDLYWFIDQAFIDRFDEYAPKAFRTIEKQAGIFNPHDPIKQIGRFIKATGCGSTAVYQLRQNFLRAANSAESLQQEGVVIPGAAKESAEEAPSMYGACMDKPYPNTDYCLCFERNAKTIMTPEEYEYFMADYSRFYEKVQKPLGESSVPASDRRWALNEIKNKCAR